VTWPAALAGCGQRMRAERSPQDRFNWLTKSMRPELVEGPFARAMLDRKWSEATRVSGRNRVVLDHFPEAADALLSVDTLR
jgi:hypothetical protein